MKKSLIVLISILALLVIIIGYGISINNKMVNADEAVMSQWAKVENQYQRRADLIPNLVSTVKSYTKHETEIIDKVLAARDQLMNADTVEEKSEADQQMDSALSGLKVVVENYPELKSNALFTQLMDELAGTENRISVARQDYNTAVRAYNAKVKRFPNNILAGLFGFSEKPYFEADPAASTAPQVSFGQ